MWFHTNFSPIFKKILTVCVIAVTKCFSRDHCCFSAETRHCTGSQFTRVLVQHFECINNSLDITRHNISLDLCQLWSSPFQFPVCLHTISRVIMHWHFSSYHFRLRRPLLTSTDIKNSTKLNNPLHKVLIWFYCSLSCNCYFTAPRLRVFMGMCKWH